MYSRALDYLQTRPEIDAKRIVVRGQSWSGYWAAKLAYTERERLRGAVVHGVGIHGYFQPEFQKKGLTTREYLFDLFPARSAVYEAKTMDEFLAYGPRPRHRSGGGLLGGMSLRLPLGWRGPSVQPSLLLRSWQCRDL
jgi:esterase FrsA